jgi:hypothetical protein
MPNPGTPIVGSNDCVWQFLELRHRGIAIVAVKIELLAICDGDDGAFGYVHEESF